jgi:hypothetical protein
MNDRAAIEQLARLVGIEVHYTDTFGRFHKVSNETLLALIGAFGLPADPAVARRELVERQRRAPLGLGPVHFVDAEATHPELVLRLRMAVKKSRGCAASKVGRNAPVDWQQPPAKRHSGSLWHCQRGCHLVITGLTSKPAVLKRGSAWSLPRPAVTSLPNSGRAPQLGPDVPALWSARRLQLGNGRLYRPSKACLRCGFLRRGNARHQPPPRAVCRQAAALQPLFAIEPDPSIAFT